MPTNRVVEPIDVVSDRGDRGASREVDSTVAAVFDDERSKLLALPDQLPSTDLVTPIAVDKTAFVRLDTNRYSVPSEYARRTVTLVASDLEVRLLDGDREIARHPRGWGRNQYVELPAHREALLAHKKQARDLKGRDRLDAEVPDIRVLVDRWVDHGRNLGGMVGRTVQLLDDYGAPTMRLAVAEMITRGTHDIGALAILCVPARPALARAPRSKPLVP